MKPLLSFVLPTFDRLEWIAESISSVLSQTEKNIELIVIDDHSTDGSWEFLNDWIKDERVTLIRNEKNLGAGPSRHKGAELAKADIICICDSDDINLDDRAKRTLEWFKAHPESEIVTFAHVSVDYDNKPIERFSGEPFNYELYEKTGQINYFCNPVSAVRKKSYFETSGYMKETDKETDDNFFIRNWIRAGKKIDFCPGPPLLLHRNLPNSMMVGIRGWKPEWATAQ